MLQEDRDPQTFILTFHFFIILPSPAPDAVFADISSKITPENAVQKIKSLGPSSARHMGTSAEPSHHPAQSAGLSHVSCSSLHRCLLWFSPSPLLFFLLIPSSFCSIWKMKKKFSETTELCRQPTALPHRHPGMRSTTAGGALCRKELVRVVENQDWIALLP